MATKIQNSMRRFQKRRWCVQRPNLVVPMVVPPDPNSGLAITSVIDALPTQSPFVPTRSLDIKKGIGRGWDSYKALGSKGRRRIHGGDTCRLAIYRTPTLVTASISHVSSHIHRESPHLNCCTKIISTVEKGPRQGIRNRESPPMPYTRTGMMSACNLTITFICIIYMFE